LKAVLVVSLLVMASLIGVFTNLCVRGLAFCPASLR
jgi:hypothetical protein